MTTQPSDRKPAKPTPKHEQGRLEKMAQRIDPPSREISDKELKDPGRTTPDTPPTDNRS